MNYLIDTNILITYIRDNELTKRLEEDIKLFSEENTLIISIVSLGEVKSIALKNNWGAKRYDKLLGILNSFLISDINIGAVVDRYAEIDAFSQNRLKGKPLNATAKNMGKNDLWIAAAASLYDLKLVTTDKDFQHLNKVYLDLQLVNLDQYAQSVVNNTHISQSPPSSKKNPRLSYQFE